MKTRRGTLVLLSAVLASACNPVSTPTSATEPAAGIAPPIDVPTAVIVLPTVTTAPLSTLQPPAALAPACAPQITANTIVNVRTGPTTSHGIIGSLQPGDTQQVDGRNAEGTWWRIAYVGSADGHGWVAASVTTPQCIPGTLPVISIANLPAPFVAAVTNVVVSVEPSEMSVTGCSGKTDWFTARALISASGPMEIQYAFEIEGVGTTKTRTAVFTEYGAQEVSERFRPEVVPGNHTVRLWIEGLDMRAWAFQTRYKILCE